MITLGVDPSSWVSGIALLDNENEHDPLLVKHWSGVRVVTKDHNGRARNLIGLEAELNAIVDSFVEPDLVVIERIAMSRNMGTVRAIAYSEAAALFFAEKRGIRIMMTTVGSARRRALGKGSMNKLECYSSITARLPNLSWSPFDKGGSDETDAFVLALAGPSYAEELDEADRQLANKRTRKKKSDS